MPFTLQIGEKAPPFNLIGTDDKVHSLSDFDEFDCVVVFFTCNHCPYVINSDETTRRLVDKFMKRGVFFIGINSNSKNTKPEDSFQMMKKRMEQHHFPWLYLYDESQEIAKKYGALRTPHFFLFDKDRKLIYTGRALDTPKDPVKSQVNYLENALCEHLAGKMISIPVTNPIGCNVKWDGKDSHWMPEEACDIGR